MRTMTSAALACLILCVAVAAREPAAAEPDIAEFWGVWGQQSSDLNKNEWLENCAQPGDLLVLTPSQILTRGGTRVYKDYPQCKVLNASGGAQVLIRAQCYDHPENAEEVTLEYAILSAGEPRRIQLRGQVSTEYLKCPSDSHAALQFAR